MPDITIAELQSSASMLADIYAAFAAGLKSLPADQEVVLDAVKIAALVSPELAPLVVLEPLAEALLVWVIENNQSGTPGSQTPIISGKKGSDPWQT